MTSFALSARLMRNYRLYAQASLFRKIRLYVTAVGERSESRVYLIFSLTGILARAADILANAKIPIFAVSTYNTDYILIKNEFFQKALDVLKENNYVIKVG